jgi:hypothetical protein
MSIARFQLALARKEVSETVFPFRAPFSSKSVGNLPVRHTPPHAHWPEIGQ